LHFLRTGDTGALLGVVDHNAWDVVAMAALVGLYGEPLESTLLEPPDLVGVARTLARAGKKDVAYDVATRALDASAERAWGAESLRARAEIAKARGDRARALADFEALAESVDCPKVRLELAKLYEHFVKEPGRALAVLARGTSEEPARAERRATRLQKKVAARVAREANAGLLFKPR
jgi:hypothetical protein